MWVGLQNKWSCTCYQYTYAWCPLSAEEVTLLRSGGNCHHCMTYHCIMYVLYLFVIRKQYLTCSKAIIAVKWNLIGGKIRLNVKCCNSLPTWAFVTVSCIGQKNILNVIHAIHNHHAAVKYYIWTLCQTPNIYYMRLERHLTFRGNTDMRRQWSIGDPRMKRRVFVGGWLSKTTAMRVQGEVFITIRLCRTSTTITACVQNIWTDGELY